MVLDPGNLRRICVLLNQLHMRIPVQLDLIGMVGLIELLRGGGRGGCGTVC